MPSWHGAQLKEAQRQLYLTYCLTSNRAARYSVFRIDFWIYGYLSKRIYTYVHNPSILTFTKPFICPFINSTGHLSTPLFVHLRIHLHSTIQKDGWKKAPPLFGRLPSETYYVSLPCLS